MEQYEDFGEDSSSSDGEDEGVAEFVEFELSPEKNVSDTRTLESDGIFEIMERCV